MEQMHNSAESIKVGNVKTGTNVIAAVVNVMRPSLCGLFSDGPSCLLIVIVRKPSEKMVPIHADQRGADRAIKWEEVTNKDEDNDRIMVT
jgi:hypothetical protein